MTELRPTTPADADLLYEVYVATRHDEISLIGWGPDQTNMFLRMQYHARCSGYATEFPNATTRVVVVDGRPVGSMIVDRDPRRILLVDIALLPEYRNRGIGGGLIRDLIEEGRREDAAVQLSVQPQNPALRLYRRLGFIVTSESPMYLEMTNDTRRAE